MILSVQIDGQIYRVAADEPLDLAIPLDFAGRQPNAYGVETASAKACEAGALIGDTRRGGSCNFEQITLIPHCNGTHTEGVGHLTRERISIHESLRDALVPATLISVEPECAAQTDENYSVQPDESDQIITRKSLEASLQNLAGRESAAAKASGNFGAAFLESLIVRVLPNNQAKLTQTYLENIPPYFSTEAMRFIVESGVRHLLVDLPSIDRLFDEGKLSNHRIFWRVPPHSFEADENARSAATITELIFVPNAVEDGRYLLNLQIAPFKSDAAPSRPLLFRLKESIRAFDE
jgi:arylformamidase